MEVVKVLLAIVLGLSMFGYGWTVYQNQQTDVQEAVTVEGTVESSDVEYHEGTGNTDGGHYEVVVRYTYTFEGQEYTSESVYPGPAKEHTEEEASEIANQYSSGQTTTVYVNQEDPSRAFLIKEKNSMLPLGAMGIGGLIALGSLFTLGKILVVGESGG
jgi:hypothetical protein